MEDVLSKPHRWVDGVAVALTAEEIAAAEANQAKWDKGEAARQIKIIEAQITPRRLREAVLGTDGGWLEAKNAEIQKLRESL